MSAGASDAAMSGLLPICDVRHAFVSRRREHVAVHLLLRKEDFGHEVEGFLTTSLKMRFQIRVYSYY
jgi:hypothetical protein